MRDSGMSCDIQAKSGMVSNYAMDPYRISFAERDVTFGCQYNGEVPFFVILALRVATVYSNYENAIKKLDTLIKV